MNKNINMQINFLTKLGITIKDKNFFQEKIRSYGFDEIVMQYLNHFIFSDNKLKHPTDFKNIYDFYELDQHLKNQFMIALQLFEQTFKTALTRQIEDKKFNFDNLKESYHLQSGRVIRRGDLRTRIRRLSKNYTEPYPDYNQQHKQITPWLLIKEMSFGVAINLFFLMDKQDQNSILDQLFIEKVSIIEFESILEAIRIFRNRAAHNYRLLGIKENDCFLYSQVISYLKMLQNFDPYQNVKGTSEQIIKDYLQKYPYEKEYLETEF